VKQIVPSATWQRVFWLERWRWGLLDRRGDHALAAGALRRVALQLVLTFDTKRGIMLSRVDNMNEPRLDLLQGTLDLLVLRTLQGGAQHGWAISERIQQISQDVLRVNQGSLTRRFTGWKSGWIKAEWGVSELGRRARFYRLTAAGTQQLDRETDTWNRWPKPSAGCWRWHDMGWTDLGCALRALASRRAPNAISTMS